MTNQTRSIDLNEVEGFQMFHYLLYIPFEQLKSSLLSILPVETSTNFHGCFFKRNDPTKSESFVIRTA